MRSMGPGIRLDLLSGGIGIRASITCAVYLSHLICAKDVP